jgi:DNA-binding transcriptional ArsR family regulator
MTSLLSVEARTSLAPAAALFHSLGDPTRLASDRRLSEGEARVVDLVTELGLAQVNGLEAPRLSA